MINANEIRRNIETDVKNKFNFKVFDAYLNDFFSIKRKNHLQIGLETPSNLERLNENDGMLAFQKGHQHYAWTSNIQITHEVEPIIEEYLKNAGFNVTERGSCSSNYYNVMIVSL